jgi:hypothetical protein
LLIRLYIFPILESDPLNKSKILTKWEQAALLSMSKFVDGILLYRATRDGFSASAFHEKCDGKDNTITIIKTDSDDVFGGFTAAKWSSHNGDTTDSKVFIFSLREKGEHNFRKLPCEEEQCFIIGGSDYGPGFGEIILIRDNSNISLLTGFLKVF